MLMKLGMQIKKYMREGYSTVMRSKVFVGIAFIVLIFGIFYGANQFAGQSEESLESREEVTFSSIYPGLNSEIHTKETEKYTTSISRPYTEDATINESINEWINQQEKEFKVNMEKWTEDGADTVHRGHLNIQVETEEIAEMIYVLEFEAYQIAGGANGINRSKAFVIDLNENEQLHLFDVIHKNEASIQNIQNLIREELYSRQDVVDYLFEDKIEDELEELDSIEWSVSREGLALYFDEYEIAAGAAGSIKAVIPLNKIKPYLQESFTHKLIEDFPEADGDTESEKDSDQKEEKKEEELDPNSKYIALTFDDGPHPEVTPRVLDALEKYNSTATFFMLGSQVDYYPLLAQRVVADGHEIGNHTMNHPDLTTLDVEQIMEEVIVSSSIIEEATGINPKLIRPPYGGFNDDVKNIVEDKNLSLIMWSVDSLDWKSREAEAINEEVMSNISDGSIILLHDIHSATADALPQLLDSLDKEGYKTISVSHLLELRENSGAGPYFSR